jgi:phosphoglucomutase
MEALESRTLKGKDGVERIRAIMDDWRARIPSDVEGVRVTSVKDYAKGIDGLPAENAIKITLADDSWFCLRPSGTEPKIKVYFATRGSSEAEAKERLERLRRFVMRRVEGG